MSKSKYIFQKIVIKKNILLILKKYFSTLRLVLLSSIGFFSTKLLIKIMSAGKVTTAFIYNYLLNFYLSKKYVLRAWDVGSKDHALKYFETSNNFKTKYFSHKHILKRFTIILMKK